MVTYDVDIDECPATASHAVSQMLIIEPVVTIPTNVRETTDNDSETLGTPFDVNAANNDKANGYELTNFGCELSIEP